MKKVLHQITTPDLWYEMLQVAIPSTIVGTSLVLKEEIGKGELSYIELQKGLWAQQINVNLREPFEMDRTPTSTNDFYVIEIYLLNSKIRKKIEGEEYAISFENVNLVLLSSTTSSISQIPKNEDVSIVNIGFTKEWLFRNVLIDHPSLKSCFETDDPIYISENMDYQLKKLLTKVNFKESKLTLLSSVVQIVDYLFSRINERNFAPQQLSYIHPKDLNKLFRIRDFIDENTNAEFSLEQLSENAGMSLSKFKRLFKQVFGTTPYQYHLANKMEKSMEALQKETYNVSEVAYIMGYSNTSKFSKAFKNHFGKLPSQVNVDKN